MMIAWKYLDKQTATINALKDYENMTCIISLTPDEIKATGDDMISPRSSSLDDMPRSRNLHSHEDMIINNISKMDVLNQRYKQAVEFMGWFKPAWDTLSEEEQTILSEFYLVKGSKTDALQNICERLNIEKTCAYTRRDKSLKHLSTLLYGI
jgi:hypothetical protein